jgi:membrane carboxypeptidase/penicillin-binding protein
MRKILITVLVLITTSVLLLVLWFLFVLRNLPEVSVLKHYRPAVATEVLDKEIY